SELDIEIVATIDELTRRRLGPLPGNIRAVPYVPLNALIPTCTAAIHHAGPGTTCTIARHGVPQVVLPWYFDEPYVARGLADAGAGITLDPAEATGGAVRDSLRRLLGEPAFAVAAGRLRDELLAQPAANELAALLPDLTAIHRGSPAAG
ncbi:nucleotide disphospho-sugar-binding domain-containing protein, partial [Prauserella cavernicola]